MAYYISIITRLHNYISGKLTTNRKILYWHHVATCPFAVRMEVRTLLPICLCLGTERISTV